MSVISPKKKIYFASDFHLGAPNHTKSLEREKRIVRWLDFIKNDAEIIFLVGDLFDFWFEYKQTIPKGFARFFGKLAELTDAGIEIIVFTGNHDMWMKDYFKIEFGISVFRKPKVYIFNDKKFYIGHGDGLGPGDSGYKMLKKVFESPISQFLFGRILHSNLSLFLGKAWAARSWKKHEKTGDNYVFYGLENEFLYQYCKEVESKVHHDFYVFGHRHYKFDEQVTENSRYINLGDWIAFNTYAVFDGSEMKLQAFEK